MKRNTAIAALTAAVLVGGGLATTAAFADSDGTRTDDSTASAGTAAGRTGAGQAVTEKTGKAGRTTVDEAVGAALKAVPGTVTEAELDDDDDDDGRRGAPRWDVDITGKDGKQHELRVDAKSGKVTADHDDHDDDSDDRDGDDD